MAMEMSTSPTTASTTRGKKTNACWRKIFWARKVVGRKGKRKKKNRQRNKKKDAETERKSELTREKKNSDRSNKREEEH
jgi:hypothetical protein